jgi:hypothetical protein
MPHKVYELDCTTGEMVERDSTPEEDAAAQANAERAALEQQAEDQERQELEAGKALWKLSKLNGATPQQAYDYIQGRLTAATTVAEVKAILVELLPALAAGLVAIGRRTLDR